MLGMIKMLLLKQAALCKQGALWFNNILDEWHQVFPTFLLCNCQFYWSSPILSSASHAIWNIYVGILDHLVFAWRYICSDIKSFQFCTTLWILGSRLQKSFNIKTHVTWQKFSNLASDCLSAQPLANQGLCCKIHVNSLSSSDAIMRHIFHQTSAEIIACCLMVPSHCLNQCWLII